MNAAALGRMTAASGWQTAFRFNTFIALALVEYLGVAALALMGVVLGVTVPLVNVLAVTALARSAPGGAAGGRGPEVLRAVARNPLIVATVAGLSGNLLGLALPSPVDATLSRLAAAAVPWRDGGPGGRIGHEASDVTWATTSLTLRGPRTPARIAG